MKVEHHSYLARAAHGALVWLLGGLLVGCGSASRAVVHKDDQQKVFPWPRGKESVSIRVKPQTGSAKMCAFCGEWETIEVTPETTFYITEQTGESFAYTPSRSPIRRLAPVERIEIRWPPAKAPAAPSAAPGAEGAGEPAGGKPPEAPVNDSAKTAPDAGKSPTK